MKIPILKFRMKIMIASFDGVQIIRIYGTDL